MQRVLIYNSPQISKSFNLQALLTRHVFPHAGLVGQVVDARNLQRVMRDDAALFILPGARASSTYRDELNGANLAHIRQHMQRGMQVLGLCAGAYVLSRAFDFTFHDESNGRVLERRHVTSPLGLVDAHAYGPDLRLYDAPAADGALQLYKAVTLEFGNATAPRLTSALVYKAPSFSRFDAVQCRPLAWYAATGEAAILRFDVPGVGRGVLSGPSIEVEGSDMTQYVPVSLPPAMAEAAARLNAAALTRRELLAQVFGELLPQAAPQIRRNLGLGHAGPL